MLLGDARTPEGMRLYAIGDIHGCDDKLAAVHAAIAADLAATPAADYRIVHVGDYVDRGPNSAGVVERLSALSASDPRIVCLRGNHDEMLNVFLSDPEAAAATLLRNGGKETFRSYGVSLRSQNYTALRQKVVAAMPPAHREFLANLPTTARFGDYLFAHAGFRPGVALEDQDRYDFMWIREEFLDDDRDFGFVVIHGHTVTRDQKPDVRRNRIDIDTGAVFDGPLTCIVLEGSSYRFL